MQKINFTDFPSTDTPIDATNLNQLQTNVENELYYKSGDVITINETILSGYISDSTSAVYFSIPAVKRLDNITSATINTGNVTARTTNQYLENNGYNGFDPTGSDYTQIINIDKDINTIWVKLKRNTPFDGMINNSPVSVALKNFNISLN